LLTLDFFKNYDSYPHHIFDSYPARVLLQHIPTSQLVYQHNLELFVRSWSRR
jgi:hypothetical protein